MLKDQPDLPLFRKKDGDTSETGSLPGARKYQSEMFNSRPQSTHSGEQSLGRRRNRSGSRTPSKSPPVRIYDPIKAEQDKVFKKKEREDIYHSHHITEEPILLIKKREIITKYISPENDTEPLTTSTIIKKTDKSKYVNVDYETAKRKIAELAGKE